jgi:uncharacterized protein YndB with AHSA1/START domain
LKRSVVVRQEIGVSRETLYRACTTARGMSGWQADEVDGDATPGGTVSLSWPALGLGVRLRVGELVVGRRVVYEVGPARLIIEIEDGSISLCHEGLRNADEEAGMRSAWQTALAVLGYGLVHYPAQPRFVRWFLQPARTTPELCHFYFSNPMGLSQWLCTDGELGPQGSPVVLRLLSGATLTGEILANLPGRDLALGWRDHHSALVLRTFPAPRDPNERLVALCWSQWQIEKFDEEYERVFEGALARLVHTFKHRGDA